MKIQKNRVDAIGRAVCASCPYKSAAVVIVDDIPRMSDAALEALIEEEFEERYFLNPSPERKARVAELMAKYNGEAIDARPA